MLDEAYSLAPVPNNRELDVLLSSGEQMSISKLAILLNELGYNAVSLTGWQAGILTSNTNQNAIIENINTERIYTELNLRHIVIIAGFQGINDSLNITTLGRGGSDTTAVAIAAALKANKCIIFSDVDGVYTTDPKKISSAQKLEHLSYYEMLDISNEGARVLHNRCVEIGEKFNIPIITKSTFNNKPGSVISNVIEENTVSSIVKNDELLLVNIPSNIYSGLQNYNFDRYGFSPIEVVSNNDKSYSFIIKTSDFYVFKKSLGINSDIEYDSKNFNITKISRIAVIGYGVSNSHIVRKILDTINKFDYALFNINITDTKLVITFKQLVDDTLLEKLHHILID